MTDWRRFVGVNNGFYTWKRNRVRTKSLKSAESVATWEKEFIWEVGSMPWKRLVDAKPRCHCVTNRIVEWNDSAGEKAFREAKLRYWLKINGEPCNMPLPNPDMYIDKIVWSKEADHVL